MKRKIPESHSQHPNVVPLIDIIMCLIIFFMLVAKIGVSSGEDEKIKIPFGLLGKEIKSMDNTLVVNVKETNGTPEVSAMLNPKTGRENIVLEGGGSGPHLGDILVKLHNANKELKLVIRGDQTLTFGSLQKVLLAAAQAKITSLNFQTTQKPSAAEPGA